MVDTDIHQFCTDNDIYHIYICICILQMVNDWEFLRPFCLFKKGGMSISKRKGTLSSNRSDSIDGCSSIDSSPTFSSGHDSELDMDAAADNEDNGKNDTEDDKLLSRSRIFSSMISVVNLLSAGLNLHHSFDELF